MKASEIVRDMFIKNGGSIVVTTLRGKTHLVKLTRTNCIASKTGLNSTELQLSIFDIVVDFLKQNGGRAPKGAGRNDKVGYGKCTMDTVCGQIAVRYFGRRIGESTFDPVFIVGAVLEKAGICENQTGYLKLLHRNDLD